MMNPYREEWDARVNAAVREAIVAWRQTHGARDEPVIYLNTRVNMPTTLTRVKVRDWLNVQFSGAGTMLMAPQLADPEAFRSVVVTASGVELRVLKFVDGQVKPVGGVYTLSFTGGEGNTSPFSPP
jgi:hypothetical protein